MKAMERIGALIGIFTFAVAAWYGIWTSSTVGIEWVGVVGLIMGGLLGFMLAFYLWRTRVKHQGDPSDNAHGEIDDIAGDYGFFSPYSWWPFWLALAAAVCFLGLAVGWWVFIIGAFFGVPALVGWTFEYWKGPHHL
ncbi:MAG TPA: cytochrome c oxidase subunit 4 [Phycicoccus sp.]|nr:cytochrome c oxidase subunit 4 [Phycicoccus sp.]